MDDIGELTRLDVWIMCELCTTIETLEFLFWIFIESKKEKCGNLNFPKIKNLSLNFTNKLLNTKLTSLMIWSSEPQTLLPHFIGIMYQISLFARTLQDIYCWTVREAP